MSNHFFDEGQPATGKKVLLPTPSYESPSAAYTFSIARSREALSQAGIQSAYLLLQGNCHVDDSRNSIVRDFLETDCTDLVFLDADVSWEPKHLVQLCQRDVDIVGGVYPYRREGGETMPVRIMTGAKVAMPLRFAIAALAAACLATPALAQEKIKFKAIGQPLATGLLQKNKEQPFFESLAQKTGLPIEVDYKPIDTLGVKDTEQLRMMKSGLFDIVSLRVSQNSRDEPMLLGLDLVGQNPDYATGRLTAKAWFQPLDERLQKQFGVKLLGIWPFGPQVLFCKKPITKLADVKGLKVRVYDQSLAKFISSLGGTPVALSFPETHQSWSLGVVDCAITGPSSANSAGWPEVSTHQLAIGFQVALNAYTITLKAWNQLKPDQQAKLKAAFDAQTEEVWKYSEELFADAVGCNAGRDPCVKHKKFKLVDVPVTKADIDLVKVAVRDISLPAWAEVCDATNPGCSQKWKQTVGAAIGIK